MWVDNLSMGQFLATLKTGVVFTLNPDHCYHLQRNQAFYEAYRQADFITSDSKFVYWGLKLIGRPIQEKVSGIAQKALERTNARVGREIAIGAHSPSMKFVTDEAEIEQVIEIIRASGANVVIVGLGAPKQEIWIQKYKSRLPEVRIWMGVGATIDYEADAVKRAPRWMTRNGLEWVYRLTTEPKRYWRRYARDLEYFWLLAVDGFGRYRNPMR
jgi:N-acetylglucosaminyldiphosphoundecaprenol N-acetyl-beta-D-mannosaminyltransferase